MYNENNLNLLSPRILYRSNRFRKIKKKKKEKLHARKNIVNDNFNRIITTQQPCVIFHNIEAIRSNLIVTLHLPRVTFRAWKATKANVDRQQNLLSLSLSSDMKNLIISRSQLSFIAIVVVKLNRVRIF